SGSFGPCALCGSEPPKSRVLPRPRPPRVAALRRRPPARARRAAAGPLAPRPRARAAACGRGGLRRLVSVDLRGLEHDLREGIEGEVRFSAGDRALYSATGANYRQLPLGVVIPRSTDDVLATVATCREHGAPLLSRGGGTGLAGQTTNV